jgi:hypothetical protein
LDLLRPRCLHFIHGHILENANVHICSLQHTAAILVAAAAAVLEAQDFFGEETPAGR